VFVTEGTTTAHVKIDVGGRVLTWSITSEAVEEFRLASGGMPMAVMTALDVMIDID